MAAARRRVRGARAAGGQLGAAVPIGSVREQGGERGREGRPAAALALARRAVRLDPLAVGPLVTEALSLQQLGRNREALAVLRTAQALQPDNFEVYYQEGLLQLKAFGRRQAALAAFKRALALNPRDDDTLREVDVLLGT